MLNAICVMAPAVIKRPSERRLDMDDFDLSRSEWECLIDQWIFSEHDRAILKRRLLDGICYEPLAEEFQLSTQRLKAIVYKAQNKLFKHIK